MPTHSVDFEAPSDDRIFYDNGARRTSPGYNSSFSGLLYHFTGEFGFPTIYVTLEGIAVGSTVDVALWVNDVAAVIGKDLVLEVDPSGASDPVEGGAEDSDFTELARLGSTVNSWRYWEPGSFTAEASTVVLRFRSLDNTGVFKGWVIDELSIVETVEVGKWEAIQNLQTLLQTLDGSPTYHTDLGDRVYTRFIAPEDNYEIAAPWCVIPLEGDEETVEYEGRNSKSSWRIRAYFYFKETEILPTSTASAGVQAAAKLRDDVIKAVLTDPDLSGSVEVCHASRIDTQAGIDPEWAEVQVLFEIMQFQDVNDLGP